REQDLAQLPDTLATRLGIATGEYAGEKIVAAAADDGTAATPPLVPPATQPGEWRPTPPAFTAGLYTHYPQVRPFVLRSAAQSRSSPPPALTSAAYLNALDEVQAISSAPSPTRTTAPTDTAPS